MVVFYDVFLSFLSFYVLGLCSRFLFCGCQWGLCKRLKDSPFSVGSIFLKIFIYLFSAVLDLRFSCTGSLRCGEWGLLCSCGVWASHFSGSSCCRAQTLGYTSFISHGSWALEHNSCSAACGIFLHQKSKPCLPQWQVDSLTLSHQESPWWMNIRMSYAGLICPFLLLSWLLLRKDCRSTDCWTCLGENHLSPT